jgi:hypothetical protein
MVKERKGTGQHKPTGQELDRQYDELHEEHDADDLSTPEEQQQQKEQVLEDYIEDLKDPD